MIDNPIEKIFRKITIKQLSIMANCGSGKVYKLKNGDFKKIPIEILNTLLELGFDTIEEDYQIWKENQRRELIEQFKNNK